MLPGRRRVRRWAFLCAGLALISIATLYLYTNSIVKQALEHFGSDMTGTEVVVHKVRADLLRGRLRLYRFRVRNPDGFRIQNAFMAESILITLNWASLLGDTVRISEVHIRNPTIVYEGRFSGSNLKRLEDSIDHWAGTEPATRVHVKRFRVSHGEVVVGTRLLGRKKGLTVKMPDIDMHNVNSGSATWRETAKTMAHSLSGTARQEARRPSKAISATKRRVEKSAQRALKTLKSAFQR
jgi:hypothetical protein